MTNPATTVASSADTSLPRVATRVKNFLVLPIRMPPPPFKHNGWSDAQQDTFHYTYIRAHAPNDPEPAQERSLFMANMPVDTTEEHLRTLLIEGLGGGRIEAIEFEAPPAARASKLGLGSATATFLSTSPESLLLKAADRGENRKKKGRKKRKRGDDGADTTTTKEARPQEDQSGATAAEMPHLTTILPSLWDRELLPPGSTAVVRFIDRPSMEAVLKTAKRHLAPASAISWPQISSSAAAPALGSRRYAAHNTLRFPSPETMQTLVDKYMSVFAAQEAAAARADARKRAAPDADGFVTVVRGGRVAPAKQDAARAMLEAQAKKEASKRQGMADFYRFQNRAEKKKRADLLIRKFEAKRKVLQNHGRLKQKRSAREIA